MTTADNGYYDNLPTQKRKVLHPLEYDNYDDNNYETHDDDDGDNDDENKIYDRDKTTITTDRYKTLDSHHHKPKENILKYIIAIAFFLRKTAYISIVVVLDKFGLP